VPVILGVDPGATGAMKWLDTTTNQIIMGADHES